MMAHIIQNIKSYAHKFTRNGRAAPEVYVLLFHSAWGEGEDAGVDGCWAGLGLMVEGCSRSTRA